MIPLTLAEVAWLTAGRLRGPAEIQVRGISIDSRTVQPGDLFIAIPGEHFDGHDHAVAAVAAGARAVLASREVSVPAVIVADTTEAVGRLARGVLDRLPDLTVVALTGSSGKTSTKDLIAQVLPELGETIAPVGSANNELGLPLTVLGADVGTRFLVLEMGARGIGHISYLCGIAPPDIALVLNVGHAHIGEFGGQSQIAQAKAELVAALGADGVAVLNYDDPMVASIQPPSGAAAITFGEGAGAEVRVSEIELDELARPSFTLSRQGEGVRIRLAFSGEHAALNAAAAASVALSLGMSLATVAERLEQATPRSRWRMEVASSSSGITVVNDAYNANPESMRAALKALAAMTCDGNRWAVLGEMLELGSSSAEVHDGVGRLAVRLDIDKLVAVGSGARPIHMGAAHEGSWGEESTWVPDREAALELLKANVRPGDVVLVKASRSVGLEQLAQALLDAADAKGGDRT